MRQPSGKILLSLLAVSILSVGLYMYKPISFNEISTVEGFVAYTRSFGPIMPVSSFVITLVQAIFPVIPFVIICSANGVLFGLVSGTLITWAGTLAGASLTFFISRRLGYEWAARRYMKTRFRKIDEMNGYKGFLVILGLRLLPYFPAPLINVSAGVSRINFFWFLLASAIGKLPFIIGYTLLGFNLLHTKNYALAATILVALLLVPYLIVRTTKRASVRRDEN